MNFLINMAGKISGAWAIISDLLPLLGGAASVLAAVATIGLRAASSKSLADLITAIHPTASELAQISLGVGVIKAHFKHNENAAAISAQTEPPKP